MSAVSVCVCVCVCVRDKDHTADVDKTKLSCLVRVGGVNTTADKTRQVCLVSTQFPISKFSVILNIFDTEQLQSGNWVETRQNCLVLSASVFTPQTWTRQQSSCRQCEQAINVVTQTSCNALCNELVP